MAAEEQGSVEAELQKPPEGPVKEELKDVEAKEHPHTRWVTEEGVGGQDFTWKVSVGLE